LYHHHPPHPHRHPHQHPPHHPRHKARVFVSICLISLACVLSQVWDVPSIEAFDKTNQAMYLRDADGVFFVYSLSDRRSIEHVIAYYTTLQMLYPGTKANSIQASSWRCDNKHALGLPSVLLKNKCDTRNTTHGGPESNDDHNDIRFDRHDEGQEATMMLSSLDRFPTSAKLNQGLETAFKLLMVHLRESRRIQ
jgi:GTPase SAR1 family protein